MRSFTPRVIQTSILTEKIGYVLNSNLFPTLLGRLLYIQNDKCYFEIIENSEYTKYNICAGQIEYLPESMVTTMKFIEE
jgi:hypothetical protein